MSFVFFFNDTATTEIYTLSLHDALPISHGGWVPGVRDGGRHAAPGHRGHAAPARARGEGHRRHHRSHRGHVRSEEHTSELQSRLHLVCRLLLEKKKKQNTLITSFMYVPI